MSSPAYLGAGYSCEPETGGDNLVFPTRTVAFLPCCRLVLAHEKHAPYRSQNQSSQAPAENPIFSLNLTTHQRRNSRGVRLSPARGLPKYMLVRYVVGT
eukprot:COSAG01_NODE_908_length_12794_cov_119.794171_11_plen_99_part_00